MREVAPLAGHNARPVDVRHRIPREAPVLDRGLECQREDAMDLADRGRRALGCEPRHPRLRLGVRDIDESLRRPLRQDVYAQDAGTARSCVEGFRCA